MKKILLLIFLFNFFLNSLGNNTFLHERKSNLETAKEILTSTPAKVIYALAGTTLGLGGLYIYWKKLLFNKLMARGKELKSVFETKDWHKAIKEKYLDEPAVRLETWEKRQDGIYLTYIDCNFNRTRIRRMYDDLMEFNRYKILVNEKPWDVKLECKRNVRYYELSFTMPKEFIEPNTLFWWELNIESPA